MNRRRILTLFSILLAALLFLNFNTQLATDQLTADSPSPPDSVTASHPSHLNLIIGDETLALPSPAVTESVLFPDWEVFVLLPANLTPGNVTALSCLFADGATSAAKYAGRIPSSARDGFLCKMPRSAQRLRPFYTPKLIGSSSVVIGSDRATEMIRWNRLAYESLSTADDVIVFAKGINKYQGKDRPVDEVSCVFSVNGEITSVTSATSSAQEVFRCPHPLNFQSFNGDVRVSVKIADDNHPIPSIAAYRPPALAHDRKNPSKSLTCACTMVYNAGKFLKEWITYHSSIGVDRFMLYDNGSDDDLQSELADLVADGGHDVSSLYWPWQKTQEAGFSHCAAAAAHASECKWMAFLDVDEFLYSPSWSNSSRPNKSMISAAVIGPNVSDKVGEVQITCVDFGPSGQQSHPRAGVTQGYTCRPHGGRTPRHKSVVRPEAVGPALRNWVHHFELGPAWVSRRVKSAVVNHYKYQAWSEFRVKFRRRVSAYVADWTERRNVGSNDRTPGLGFADVEPEWWARGRCEVRDEGFRDLVRGWFARDDGRFGWEN